MIRVIIKGATRVDNIASWEFSWTCQTKEIGSLKNALNNNSTPFLAMPCSRALFPLGNLWRETVAFVCCHVTINQPMITLAPLGEKKLQLCNNLKYLNGTVATENIPSFHHSYFGRQLGAKNEKWLWTKESRLRRSTKA